MRLAKDCTVQKKTQLYTMIKLKKHWSRGFHKFDDSSGGPTCKGRNNTKIIKLQHGNKGTALYATKAAEKHVSKRFKIHTLKTNNKDIDNTYQTFPWPDRASRLTHP